MAFLPNIGETEEEVLAFLAEAEQYAVELEPAEADAERLCDYDHVEMSEHNGLLVCPVNATHTKVRPNA